MLTTLESIIKQRRLLLPTGRAWRAPDGSYMNKLFLGLGEAQAQAYEGGVAVLDAILADNSRFTSDDATMWEKKLGLITNLAVPLADRMAAIRRKYAAPGIQPAHGHYLYIERQLQAAGFNVWVHENRFPLYPSGYESVPPTDIYPTPSNYTSEYQYDDFQYGDPQFGLYYTNMVVNSIYQAQDNSFNLGGTFAAIFFIGGQTLGTYASVLASREIEFRQLILSLKQTQLAASLFINYI